MVAVAQNASLVSLGESDADGARGALFERAREGDGAAFGELYALHARYVAGVVFRLLGNDGDMDDVVQDTFIDAMSGLKHLREPAALRAWLVTVAVRRTKRVLAKRRRRAFFAALLADHSAQSSDPRDRQPVDELYDALDRLPSDLRIPWTLHRVEHLSLPEAAAACEVSLATVKRRIAEAEERIQKRIAP